MPKAALAPRAAGLRCGNSATPAQTTGLMTHPRHTSCLG